MEFFRAAQQPTWPDGDENMHTYTDDRRCPQKHARQFDFLEGEWEGTLRYQQNGQWEEVPASLRAWKVLNGCAVLQLLRTSGPGLNYKELRFRVYQSNRQEWAVLRLDNQLQTGFVLQSGRMDGQEFILEEKRHTKQAALQKTYWKRFDHDNIEYQ